MYTEQNLGGGPTGYEFLTTQLFETPTSKKSSLLVLAGRPSSLLTVGLQGRIWMLPGTAYGMHR